MEKAKRKGNPEKANRRFALVLIGFIVFTASMSLLLVVFGYSFNFPIPLIVIRQPFTNLTPILYLIISLVWIPFAIKHHRIYDFRKLHWVLIISCILSVALMTWFLYEGFTHQGGFICPNLDSIPYTPFAIFKGWDWGCYWILF